MPNTSNSAKKNNKSEATSIISPQKEKKSRNKSVSPDILKNSNKVTRKRKRWDLLKSSESELESELEECNLEDAMALEQKLRKVAKINSLNDDEMRKLLQKFVKNEHVLALVTLKAEHEVAHERRELDQRAITITDTLSVPKLTRAKARELNTTPAITLPDLSDKPRPEIAALIKEDLHSDEDDEEYVFKEEDFVSDDDPNTTVSDFDSNPCTPQTPATQAENENSPAKLTSDGCFKVPFDKRDLTQENMRIAARTRSKLCLQQTTIEDIQSEFVPPDVDASETHDIDASTNDEDWMQFLNEFSKPLNNSLLGDDDDPVNDPEYIAADKERVDAEELRDVNISKKELTELVAELIEGFVNEGGSLESIDLETPQKFLENSMQVQVDRQTTPTATVSNSRFAEVSRHINFDEQTPNAISHPTQQPTCVSDATISSTNITQTEYSFQPDVMSTPTFENGSNSTLIPIAAIAATDGSKAKTILIPDATVAPELIAVPVPGQPNHFHLARVETKHYSLNNTDLVIQSPEKFFNETHKSDNRYIIPYDNNFTWRYISIKRHIYSEYIEKFENLRNVKELHNNTIKDNQDPIGFTQYQHDLLQQQLRIHVQMLTQTYLQIYSHPELWKMAPQVRALLDELHEKATTHATFNAWNLKEAINLINSWEQELTEDTSENKEMMNFLHKEIHMTNKNTRQIPRFAPRIMDFILESKVFMYPSHLPRIPFTPKILPFESFSPSESLLIALGLDKNMKRLKEKGHNISKKMDPLVVACKYMIKDTVFGKSKRRIWDQVKKLRKATFYNPVKYYFEHNCAPPVEHELITFENNSVLPPIQRISALPLVWQNYAQKKNQKSIKNAKAKNKSSKSANRNTLSDSDSSNCFFDIVREAIGENIQYPSQTSTKTLEKSKKSRERGTKLNNVTINVNYVFGETHRGDVTSLANATTFEKAQLEIDQLSPSSSIVAYNYDYNLKQLEPVINSKVEHAINAVEKSAIPSEFSTDGSRNDIDITSVATTTTKTSIELSNHKKSTKRCKSRTSLRRSRKNWFHNINDVTRFRASRKSHRLLLQQRRKRALKQRFIDLFRTYCQRLKQKEQCFNCSPLILRYYKHFRALDLYTEVLVALRMFCRNTAHSPTNNACSSFNKRVRSEDDTCSNTPVRSKKVNRQEENLRNMLFPDSVEDSNRKDAIYAFNFYEKVEEVFKSVNRADDYEKFNKILTSFNPKVDRAAGLYNKLEAVFLPDYPELAQLFLTFLMPPEAAEVGKFFEHFMITNMTTFINKLNVYFNKQPAQIRKIYNCLSDLANEPHVTIKEIEARILPLLKGNQFLMDWFMQQFSEAPVPDRFLPTPEHVNLKEILNCQNGEFVETMKDILESPNSDQQPQCQLRYINGRIFYGSKMTLPAKLSFMAKKYTFYNENEPTTEITNCSGCLHGIKQYGEQRLTAAVGTTSNNAIAAIVVPHNEDTNEDTTDKSEDEFSKALIIDATISNGEEDSCSSIEACDEATLRSHAMRLNPSYYSSSCFTSATATSTPNFGNFQQIHHSNAKKQSLNFYDDIRISPRKSGAINLGTPLPPQENTCTNVSTLREKRKSPTKKIRSPNTATKSRTTIHQPMVIIHQEHNSGPIAYAKKLKSLIDSNDEHISHTDQQIDKIHEPIIARVKERVSADTTNIDQSSHIVKIDSSDNNSHFVAKYENSDDMEFLPEHTPPRKKNCHQKMNFPRFHSNSCSSKEECSSSECQLTEANTKFNCGSDTAQQRSTAFVAYTVSAANVDNDEDCKLDIVATLATTVNSQQHIDSTTKSVTAIVPLPITTNAFTRDEDKVILIEMKVGSNDRNDLFTRINAKLPNRTIDEISTRHQFLMDFLSKLQGKHLG